MIDILLICPEITKGMKSIGSKCLLQLKKNMTLVEYQIIQLQKIKSSRITINIGFDSEKIISILQKYKKINYTINSNYNNTNHGTNLISYIKKYSPKNLLVFSSGVLIKNDIIDKKFLTDKNKIFVLNKTKQNFNLGCCNTENIEYIFYDMPEPWSEIVFLNTEAIELLLSYNEDYFNQMYLFEIINFLLKHNIEFDKIYLNKTDLMKIENIKDLQTAKLFI
jgi:NDP-sugar pyrophosphorylase family protein